MLYYLALYCAKIVNSVSRILNIGSGYTWPGHIALRIYPQILSSSKINLKHGVVIISGTNGKTTTSKLITHLLNANDLEVLHNKTGANLINGIVSEILIHSSITGKINADIAVFEVDEFALPILLEHMSPKVLTLLNLSRDQLDRYGETDIVFEKWSSSIAELDGNTSIVLDSEQKIFKKIPSHFEGNCYFFDANTKYGKTTKLKGKFNLKNVNASLLTVSLLGFDEELLAKSLVNFDFAYGRGEKIGKFHIYLAKNPASFNHNLSLLSTYDKNTNALLFVLNDNIPDGRDVSWIYDIDTKLLTNSVLGYSKIYVSGTRAYDMAVRLKYAEIDIDENNINTDLKLTLKKIKENDSFDVLVFPNYSAMLETRKFLTGKSIL